MASVDKPHVGLLGEPRHGPEHVLQLGLRERARKAVASCSFPAHTKLVKEVTEVPARGS